MWIPTCCNSDYKKINQAMTSNIKIYCKKLTTRISDNRQKSSYTSELVITKRCHVRDRSIIAQDTAINSGNTNPEKSKEFIVRNFDVTALDFNQIEWAGSKFQVLSVNKNHSAVLSNRTRIYANDAQPFIIILAGMTEL